MSLVLFAEEVAQSRWGLSARVRAENDGDLVCLDRFALDRESSRGAFARAVCAKLVGTDPADVKQKLLELYERVSRDQAEEGDEGTSEGEEDAPKSQASRLVAVADDADLFHSPEGDPYAVVPVDGHGETWALRSRAFKDWLSRRYHLQFGTAPNSQAIADALNVLRGRALFEGPEWPIFTRVAELGDAIYLDLGDSEWRAVEITRTGWRVIADSPVRFHRSKGMLPLLLPVPGGSLDDLDPFLNVPEGACRLLKTVVVMMLRPRGPYPILIVQGEQGSAKSTLVRLLRALVDPNTAPLRSKPRDERDLLIAAKNGWLVPLDNLSSISDDLSDALCRLSTGGGLGTRQLHTDADEMIFNAMRLVILNGIEDLATRGDLGDRAVIVEAPRIDKRRRKPENVFWREFEAVRPRVLGALLDAAVLALANEAHITLAETPRMADFATWGAAAAPALGWTADEFLLAYAENRRQGDDAPLQSSPLTGLIKELMATREIWEGTATELLGELEGRASDAVRKIRAWPKDATRLSGALKRLAPSLLSIGLDVEFLQRTADGRPIRIARAPTPDEAPPPRVEERRNGASSPSLASPEVGGLLVAESTRGDAGVASSVIADPDGVISAAGGDAANVPADAVVGASVTARPGRDDGRDADDAPSRLSPTNIVLIADAPALTAILPELQSAPVLGFDVETTGLDPRSHRIRLIQLAVPGGPVYVVDLFSVDARILEPLFAAGPRLVGHNLKFDLAFLAAAGLPMPEGKRLFDTMLATQLLGAGTDDGRLDRCGLQAVAQRHLGMTIDKSLQASDWTGTLSTEQVAYAAQDALILLPLAETLRGQIREAKLGLVMALEMRTLPCITWLESTGAPFDAEAWVGLSDRVVEDQVRLEQALTEMAGREDQAEAKAINWRSPEQVKRVLRERGHDVERTDEATLTGLAPDDPLARLLLQYREAVTRASRYGIAFLKNVDAGTGRIHADYFQLGAASGRMSCRGPNLQQVPRDPAYRACFRPAPGRVLVKADYSQIELRIAAEITGDQRMLDAYLANSDLHMVTAAAVLGRSNGTAMKADRQLAKAINFGLLYGMGAPRLREYAIQNYGVELTPAQAENFREKFLSTFPGLRGWHRRQGNVRPEEPDTRTLAGRRRLAVKKYTERLNTPVQGTGADGLKAALTLLWETRERVPSAAPVLCIHDEIVLEVDERDAEQARDWLVECMVRGMRSFLHEVPVEVEAEIIADWSGTPVEAPEKVNV